MTKVDKDTNVLCKDLISRQAAIDAINTMFAPTPTQMDMKEDCLEIIENLPSAQPESIEITNELIRILEAEEKHGGELGH